VPSPSHSGFYGAHHDSAAIAAAGPWEGAGVSSSACGTGRGVRAPRARANAGSQWSGPSVAEVCACCWINSSSILRASHDISKLI